jgi:small-conductance mechanosensitive channel
MRNIAYLVIMTFSTLFFMTCVTPVFAQDQPGTDTGTNVSMDAPCAVTVKGQRLFIYYSSLDGKSPQDRAMRTVGLVERITQDHQFDPGFLRIKDTPTGTDLVYNDQILATVTIDDAKAHKSSTRKLAYEFSRKLRSALSEKKEEITAGRMAYAVSATVIATIVLLIFSAIVFQLGAYINKKLHESKGSNLKSIKIQKATLMSADMMANLIGSVIQIVQWIVVLAAIYVYLLFILEAFPNTTAIGLKLKEASLSPVTQAMEAFLNYLPSLFAILVIALLTYGAIALARFFFDALDAGTIKISGFEQEWATPTYKIARVFIVLFFLVLALPYAPGYESESFKQVGLLFGLLFSLGSTSVVGHILAGTVLTYSKAFKIGDRINVGSCTGDIFEKSMFVTRIKTPKNEIISIPNAEILNSHIINYSKMADKGGLILHTKITIGYDVPHKTVKKLLLDAAGNTEHILNEPQPFVLGEALGDFSVTYELNAYTHEASLMPSIYSELHENIMDQFNQAGLEIMSPRFFSLRDGNGLQIPEENVPSGHESSSFQVRIDEAKSKN